MAITQYAFHGLLISSDIPLAARRLATADREPDVEVTTTDEPPVAEDPGWRELASRDAPFRFRAYATLDGYVIDAHACQFHLDRGLRRLELRRRADTPLALLPLLLIGTGLSVVAILRGRLVLHASAVCNEHGAIAVAGQTGTGKSTLAASLCSAGWELLADDAVCVEQAGDGWLAHSAAAELRLRQGARALARGLPDASSFESIDGRLTLRPRSKRPAAAAPLLKLIFPRFSQVASATTSPLSQKEAAVRLLRNVRVGSWSDPAVLERLTRQAASLARQVPCVEMLLPPGSALDGAMARSVEACLEDATQGDAAPT